MENHQGKSHTLLPGGEPSEPAPVKVGRFAPSPSGRMHLGNLFTALMAWLSVRAAEGEMVLRIEDLDPQRSKKEYIEALREDLLWLGLDWDREMPLQSTRDQIYEAHFRKLPVYPCYCTRSELHDASAPHASDGRIVYPGTCRGLTPAQRAAQTRRPSWRVRVPEETVFWRDGLWGEQQEALAQECGDFVVRRSDGVFAYQLAVVCDDALGGVTEVVRGSDLLGSTARQIWLFRALGYRPPDYCHVPLLVDPEGRRLSKRQRDLDLGALRARYSPEEIIGGLAFLSGLIPSFSPMTPRELIPFFSWKRIERKPLVVGSAER